MQRFCSRRSNNVPDRRPVHLDCPDSSRRKPLVLTAVTYAGYTSPVAIARNVAGILAASVPGVLLVVVLVRDVGLNPLNGWTILLGSLGAGLFLIRSDPASAFAASLLLLLALLPALIGGLGLLYVPSLVLGVVVGAGGEGQRSEAGHAV